MDNNQYQTPYYATRPRKAVDFRRIAKRALKGFWWIAAGVTFLAVIFGGLTSSGVSVGNNSGVSFDETDLPAQTAPILTPEEAEVFEQALKDLNFKAMGDVFRGDYPLFAAVLSSFVLVFVLTTVVLFLLRMFVSSPVKVGYQKFCLNILDGNRPGITLDTLFERFGRGYLKTVGLNFVHSLILDLTTLPTYIAIFIGGVHLIDTLPKLLASELSIAVVLVPFATFSGIVSLGSLVTACIRIPVTYAYSMAHLIMADYPGVGAIEALRLSRQMMKGNKFRLFCLDFSFIGWELLAICCSCGLGLYFVTPYQQVARAAFYHEVSNRTTPEDVEFPSINPEDYYID